MDNKVLFVNNMTFGSYFKALGYHIDFADNGDMALAKLRQQTFDVTVTDITELAMIRSIASEDIDTVVIVLTDKGTYEEVSECINLGVSAWFDKATVDLNELRSRIEDGCRVVPERLMRKLTNVITD